MVPVLVRDRSRCERDSDLAKLRISPIWQASHEALTRAGFHDHTPAVGDSLVMPFMLKKSIDEWGKTAALFTPSSNLRR
jgi:hypothetical protein